MRRLTEDEKIEYINNDGIQCPFCGDAGIDEATLDTDGQGEASSFVKCSACKRTWWNVYKLTAIDDDTELKS